MPSVLPVCRRLTVWLSISLCAIGILSAGTADEPSAESAAGSDVSSDTRLSDNDNRNPGSVPLAIARDRAKLMHQIYATTLDVMHDRYFHGERAVVPARAMEDVFSELEHQSGSRANWISVNMRPMSINHEPKTEFEKRAVREIVAGKSDIEVIEDGFYRRAGPILMTGGCIGCHGGFASPPSKAPKFTGLIISIPIIPEISQEQR